MLRQLRIIQGLAHGFAARYGAVVAGIITPVSVRAAFGACRDAPYWADAEYGFEQSALELCEIDLGCKVCGLVGRSVPIRGGGTRF